MTTLHPFTILFHVCILFIMVLTYNHPLYVILILIYLILLFILLGKGNRLVHTIKYSLYMFALILIINPLVSSNGNTIIYKSSRLPVIGEIQITLESMIFGVNMGLKLISIVLIFKIYDVLVDRDNAFSFFSKYLNRLALTVSMTVNIIYRLKLDISRVKDVMILRGAKLKQKNLFKKIKAYYPILKVVLISSLEGSLDRAEALYSKGYGGKQARSNYSELSIHTIDFVLNICTGFITILFIYSIFSNKAGYKFYPVIQSFNLSGMGLLVLLSIFLGVYVFLMWWCKKWKLLK